MDAGSFIYSLLCVKFVSKDYINAGYSDWGDGNYCGGSLFIGKTLSKVMI